MEGSNFYSSVRLGIVVSESLLKGFPGRRSPGRFPAAVRESCGVLKGVSRVVRGGRRILPGVYRRWNSCKEFQRSLHRCQGLEKRTSRCLPTEVFLSRVPERYPEVSRVEEEFHPVIYKVGERVLCSRRELSEASQK